MIGITYKIIVVSVEGFVKANISSPFGTKGHHGDGGRLPTLAILIILSSCSSAGHHGSDSPPWLHLFVVILLLKCSTSRESTLAQEAVLCRHNLVDEHSLDSSLTYCELITGRLSNRRCS